jgi:hypothetical protein
MNSCGQWTLGCLSGKRIGDSEAGSSVLQLAHLRANAEPHADQQAV